MKITNPTSIWMAFDNRIDLDVQTASVKFEENVLPPNIKLDLNMLSLNQYRLIKITKL